MGGLEPESKGELETLFGRLADGYERPGDQDAWVSEFFKREERYRSAINVQLPYRPLGTMRTKDTVREGARSEDHAVAYARWNKRPVPDEGLHALLAVYLNHFDGVESFDTFLDTHAPRRTYERLSVVTPVALYSLDTGTFSIEEYRFTNDAHLSHPLDSDMLVAMIAKDTHASSARLPRVFTVPFLNSIDGLERTVEDIRSDASPPFSLFRPSVRVRSPSPSAHRYRAS